MPETPFDRSLRIIASSGNYFDILTFLDEMVNTLADVRHDVPGLETVADRRSMTAYLEAQVARIKRIRHNLSNQGQPSSDDVA